MKIKKLLSLILAVVLFNTLCIPTYAASKEDLEAEIQQHETMKNKIHEAAELLRSAGYNDSTIAIQALKNDWSYEHNRQVECQKQLDELIASTPAVSEYVWNGPKLTKNKGVNYGPTGKETYYNLNMSGVVSMMRNRGYDAANYPYWVRNDDCKMLGPYIMVAANLSHFPRGSIVNTSLGQGLVCDTGHLGWSQLDLATCW